MIRNQFKQEVIDAATAVSHYFEIRQKDNGRYEVVLEQDKMVIGDLLLEKVLIYLEAIVIIILKERV